MPHARMRIMYRALVEVRALSRRRGMLALPRGLEACWVAPLIDLHADDLVSDTHAGDLLAYIRSAGLRPPARGPSLRQLRTVIGSGKSRRPPPLPSHAPASSGADRLLGAAGMAVAAKALKPGSAVIAFAQREELTTADWSRVLTFSAAQALPLIVVVLGSLSQQAGAAELQQAARKAGLASPPPSIRVDAGDAVALYRVAQESLLRVRTDGGPVVIDCVPTGRDSIALLGKQLLGRGICTRSWLIRVEKTVADLIARV